MTKIWIFSDSGEAYDASQTSDVIKDGDVLIGIRDRVAGFLFKAWPVAVTEKFGKLGGVKNDDYAGLNNDRESGSTLDYAESARLAQTEAARLDSLEPSWSTSETPIETLYPDLHAAFIGDTATNEDHDETS